jgi:hypothetical protein
VSAYDIISATVVFESVLFAARIATASSSASMLPLESVSMLSKATRSSASVSALEPLREPSELQAAEADIMAPSSSPRPSECFLTVCNLA